MPTAIQDTLFQRLVQQGQEDEPFALCVLAACEGAEALAAFVFDCGTPDRPATTSGGPASGSIPPTYVASIQVRGFRGIGDDSHLRFTPGPGVTLIVGRNCSGKSSFAEAAEVAFTGTSARWAAKGSIEWQKGWRNVNSELAPRLVVELVQEGIGANARVERTWSDPGEFKSGVSQVVGRDKSRQVLADSGWGTALEHYRPFLSYSELGGMLAGGPTKIYEALLAGLGLEEYVRVRDCLAAAEGEQGKRWDLARKAAVTLGEAARDLAAAHPDEARFAGLADLLGKTRRDVEAIDAIVSGRFGDDKGQVFEGIASVAPPVSSEAVISLPVALRALAADVEDVRGRTEGQMLGLSKLLGEALAYAQAAAPEACPVCGSDRALDAVWQAATRARLAEIETTASRARVLEERMRDLVRLTRAACTAPPPVVTQAIGTLPSADRVVACWNDWARGSALADAAALAAHVEATGATLLAALDDLRKEAESEAARRDVVWQPFAREVADWVAEMRQATKARAREKELGDAKKWVAAQIEDERESRFAPVKARAIQFWNLIARESNVHLQDIELTGHGTAKRVALKVTVDDKDAPALGVLSQGELNAMTLSLFLPRVLMPATPFGFVIVDDPVQAMDEVRVDGLAHVLSEVGRTRQVVVFTHDARLPEAFERLSLPHAKRRVTRGLGSAVVVSPLIGPWEQRLKDARDVTQTPDLPAHISGRVVPGFCRQALEAVCLDVLRRHWLARGDAFAEVEKRLARPGLRELLSLLFFGDAHKHQGLDARLRKLKVQGAVEIYLDCQSGAHEGFTGDLVDMVDRTRALCDALGKVTPP